MNRFFLLIIFGLTIGVQVNAKSRESLMTDSLKSEQQLPSLKEKQLAIQLEIVNFLMRQDSAMLIEEANFLKKIDSTYVNPRQKEYYEYLKGVLLVQEEMKEVEAISQTIMELEEKIKVHKRKIADQIENLRNDTNTLIDRVNDQVIKLSPEHDLYLDNLIRRVIVIRDKYKVSPPSKKSKKK